MIKKIILPFIRLNGFKGSFPNLRRLKNEQLNLLSFQFHRFGDSFTIEIANCPPEGVEINNLKLPPEKCKPSNIRRQRIRVGNLPRRLLNLEGLVNVIK